MASSYPIEPPQQERGASASVPRQVPCPECQSPVLVSSQFCSGCGAVFTQRERTTHLITPEDPDQLLGIEDSSIELGLDERPSPSRRKKIRALKNEYQRAWLFGFWSGFLLPFAWLVPLVSSILDQSNPHGGIRRRAKGVLLGFAVGFAVLVVMLLLVWVALSAFSLRADLNEVGLYCSPTSLSSLIL